MNLFSSNQSQTWISDTTMGVVFVKNNDVPKHKTDK